MEAQDKQENGIPTPEVMTALLDLARLSHQVESAASQTPGTIATMLLERLLVLCDAQRGAILLQTQRPAEAKHKSVLSPPGRKTFRTFALHNMSEEEARALVATCSVEDIAIQSPPGEPCWVICRLPISVPLSGGQAPLAQQQDNGAEPSVAGQPSHLFLPLYALLVLGWDENDERACIAASKKGQTVLPLVADVAGSALTNILLAERIYEFEAAADQKALREMEMFKAELLATVSHELRSPLASVKGYAATLLRHERRISREERHEFLLAIKEASDRLEAVIDRLLEISQADRNRLREVLDNLFENAINYSPEGGAIEVVVRSLVASGQAGRSRTGAGNSDHEKKTGMPPSVPRSRQMLEICVRDHGIGIPPAHLERIFDRFYRVDTRLTREVNGIGLGLAICKRIVELHGGMIWAESEVGKGSAFYVWLPM